MSAKMAQIGGTHYLANGGVQHWTYCDEVCVPYLESAATKYLTRWEKKGGVQDLEKAHHYMRFRIEQFHKGLGPRKGANKKEGLFNRFVKCNELDQDKRMVIDAIMHWRSSDQLDTAYTLLVAYIDKVLANSPQPNGYVNQDR